MSDVRRVFVEKKPGFDVEAQQMKTDLIENLGMKAIEGFRLLNRYDVSGLSASTLPLRGATFSSRLCTTWAQISIHAPLTGSDAYRLPSQPHLG